MENFYGFLCRFFSALALFLSLSNTTFHRPFRSLTREQKEERDRTNALERRNFNCGTIKARRRFRFRLLRFLRVACLLVLIMGSALLTTAMSARWRRVGGGKRERKEEARSLQIERTRERASERTRLVIYKSRRCA